MPTVWRQDGFEIRIYFNDHDPPHIHAFKAGGQAKVQLGNLGEPPSLQLTKGMSAKDAQKAVEIVKEHQATLLTKWEELHD
jgi:predicted ATP-binding protein involved in virulence